MLTLRASVWQVSTVNVQYLSIVHVLNYVWKRIVTWASGREDYMHIGAFHHAQVVSSIPSVLIGCELRSSYASVNICWPTHWHLFVSQCQLGCRAGKYYFLLCVRAVASSSTNPEPGVPYPQHWKKMSRVLEILINRHHCVYVDESNQVMLSHCRFL